MYIHAYICIHPYTFIPIYTYIHTYTYINIYTHTYIHTYVYIHDLYDSQSIFIHASSTVVSPRIKPAKSTTIQPVYYLLRVDLL